MEYILGLTWRTIMNIKRNLVKAALVLSCSIPFVLGVAESAHAVDYTVQGKSTYTVPTVPIIKKSETVKPMFGTVKTKPGTEGLRGQ